MTQDQYNGVSVITVSGDLVGPEATALREAASVPSHARACVIDLEQCRFMASDGLESLLAALRSHEAAGSSLKLAGLDANCRTILQLTRLDHRFECCADVASALKLIS
jgi:anti-anti-sigma factor